VEMRWSERSSRLLDCERLVKVFKVSCVVGRELTASEGSSDATDATVIASGSSPDDSQRSENQWKIERQTTGATSGLACQTSFIHKSEVDLCSLSTSCQKPACLQELPLYSTCA
jgi:hypothetical protein